MSDDMWRRNGGAGDDDQFDDFGELRFSDDEAESDEQPALSFNDDTGPLPHWTEPPTGDLPRLFDDGPRDRSGSTSRPVVRESASTDEPGGDDVDIWGSYSGPAPRPVPDQPSGPAPRPVSNDTSGSRPRVRLGEPTGGTRRDPSSGAVRRDDGTTGSTTRPMPVSRRDDTSGTSRTGRVAIGADDTQGRPVTGSRPRPTGERGPRPRPEARPGGRAPRTSSAGVGGRDMPSAIAAGLLIAAAFIGALMWKPVAVLAIVVLVTGLAAVEFFEKVTERGYSPAAVVGIATAICAPLAAYWVGEGALPLVFVFAFMASSITYVGAENVQSSPMPNMAITTLGSTWIGLMGAYAALIAAVSNVPGAANIGTDTLFIVAVGVVANDVGALFVGSAAGRSPLRAWISPNKTVEGFLGGALATLVAVWVVSLQSDTWNDIGEVLMLAVVIAVLAPIGDLVESMFKRNLDIKDFGTVIKGHGGVLDRFDGFLFVLPAAYYLLRVLEPFAS